MHEFVKLTIIALEDNHKKEPAQRAFFYLSGAGRIEMRFAADRAVSLVMPNFSGALP
ncbi:hypothetical protein [Bradyrhizobium sp.]|uniref:hypothetical protein n=1 Tax=Bradyrhizobium sp. TaxID=376 RepID=UPI002DF99D66|nr:hypothetical protein [Bradyrhizobium sp.]